MKLLPETYHAQQQLAGYCRTGSLPVIAGASADRLPHYRRLVFNIISDTMETAFPLAHSLVPPKKWERMLHDFFAQHACQSYQIWKLPNEFYIYAVEQQWADVYRLPFLNDLLAFEWAEMELYNMEDMPMPVFHTGDDWLNVPLVLNPEYRLLSCTYPVHLSADKKDLIARKGVYFILLHRLSDSGQVQFTDLSPWLAFTIEQLSAGFTLHEIIACAPELGITVTNTLKNDTLEFLRHMQEQQLVLGVAGKK